MILKTNSHCDLRIWSNSRLDNWCWLKDLQKSNSWSNSWSRSSYFPNTYSFSNCWSGHWIVSLYWRNRN